MSTLITGADGHVGKALARWLIANSGEELVLFVRAGDSGERAAKLARLGELAEAPRCRVVFGDLSSDEPFASVSSAGITDIIHAAAVTDFAVEKETARAVNVNGTARLVEFAGRCKSLRRFGLVSTLYTAGLRTGEIREVALGDAAGFANHYEWSKWQAERLLCDRPDLPWQIYRVGTILAEDETGIVNQFNVVHNTLRLLYYGLLSVIPGDPGTRVYFVTSGFVARAIGQLFLGEEAHGIYHVADSGNDAMTLGSITDLAYEAFLGDRQFARQRILKPLYCDLQAFQTLAGGIRQFRSSISQALDSVVPFAPQLYRDKNYSTTRLDSALAGARSPDPRKLLVAVADHLVKTRWGLNLPPGQVAP